MKKSIFQYILLFVFGFAGIFGILIFSGIIPIGGEGSQFEGEVVVWGFLPENDMSPILSKINLENRSIFSVKYLKIDRNSFENELVNSLARGDGPDVVMFPQDLILKQGDKLFPIPYEVYSERDFKNNFAESGELFLTSDGIISLPLYTDPVVMYWNRDLFTNAGITTFPRFWVEFLNLPANLTTKDSKGNIFQSAVSMGTYQNINNAKEIISTLLLQVGDKIVDRIVDNNGLRTNSFTPTLGSGGTGAESAINFYTEFSNQAKAAYSWNSSLPDSRKYFESGKLAVYIGLASEYSEIKNNNPHLNFDVSVVPQREESRLKITYGDMVGLSVVKGSKKPNTALRAVYALTNADSVLAMTNNIGLPALRRDILSTKPTDPIMAIFNDSAIISRGWYDPDSRETDLIFSDIVNSVLSGRKTTSSAISDARIRLVKYVK